MTTDVLKVDNLTSSDFIPRTDIELADFKSKLIYEVVKKTFIQLAITLTCAAVGLFFVTSPVGIAVLLISAIGAAVLSGTARSLSAYFAYAIYKLNNDKSEDAENTRGNFSFGIEVCKWFGGFSQAFLSDLNTINTLAHEAGHLAAVNMCYVDAKPYIELEPFIEGSTNYVVTDNCTSFGNAIGENNRELLIAAAGPLVSVGLGIAGFAASFPLRESYPELSAYIKISAITTIVQQAIYALSALWAAAGDLGNDFVAIWAQGVHPIISVICILIVPIIIQAGICLYNYLNRPLLTAKAV